MGEEVSLSVWRADAPIVQSLTAATVWPTLTRHQRALVASCRETVDPAAADFYGRYRVVLDRLAGQPARTLASLRAKGVLDDRGNLTADGIYTALWHRLGREAGA